jgi:trehalose 6-phosphate synthase/phosphatase
MPEEGPIRIVSNRLPVVLKRRRQRWEVEPGAGGLVQALRPILRDRGGAWIGWPGVTAESGDGWRPGLQSVSHSEGYDLVPVVLDDSDVEGFYEGFANSIVWPLFHGFPDRCSFDASFFASYGRVNQKFTQAIADSHSGPGFLWIHDYHLFEVARRLRELGHQGPLAFFLHIPFPSVENFAKLPWRESLLQDLLHFDLIGFQTRRDLRHFQQCLSLVGVHPDLPDSPAMQRFRDGDRTLWAGAFPIGMDFRDFAARSLSTDVSTRVHQLRHDLGSGKLLLGIDRLDYTKGLIHRLKAYEQALTVHPALREEVVYFQLVVPSRENVPEYRALKREFDRVVGRINGRFSTPRWRPIHYLYNRVDPVELSALYRLADVALVTPLRDGMNLVAKEYCASQTDDAGALILSEFAGAAEQLQDGALLVNPYDIHDTARAIYQALSMPPDERRRRMRLMRTTLAESDVFWWASSFLETALMPSASLVTQQTLPPPGADKPGHPA